MNDTTEKIIAQIQKGAGFMTHQFDPYRDNKEIVLEVVKQFPSELKSASDRLRDDKDIVLEALKQNGQTICYASERLRDEKEIVLLALKQKHSASLSCASERLRDDKEVVLEAVRRKGINLISASDRLVHDNDVVSEAVKQDPHMEGYAKKRIYFLKLDSQRTKDDHLTKDAAIEMLRKGFLFLDSHEFDPYRDDKDVVLEAVKRDSNAIAYATERLRGDKDIALEIVKKDGLKILEVSRELMGDRDVLLEAFKQTEVSNAFIRYIRILLRAHGKHDNEISALIQSVLADASLKSLQEARDNIKPEKDTRKKEGVIIGRDAHETMNNLKEFFSELLVFIVILGGILILFSIFPSSCRYNSNHDTPDSYYRK